jgi:DNA helicase-2/ATP-dependent DNA helicase PcrA
VGLSTLQIDTLLAGLNPEQRAAAEAVEGAVCILAGAGTGKTRTITHRIALQIAEGTARPEQILAVTFTERAAAELAARLSTLGIPGPVRTATFHSAAWAQLRYFWRRVSDEPLPDVLPSKLPLLGRAALRLHVEARDLAAEIEWAKARGIEPDAYWQAAVGRDLPAPADVITDVFAEYERAKTDANAIDYEDMILRTASLLESDDEAAAEVRDRYRHLTVDEFQDVNPAQWRLLQAWTGPAEQLCVVGDDDQSIYGFTGASPEYLLTFTTAFPGARRFRLSRNYRSTPNVLDLANAVLGRRGSSRRLVAARPPGPAPQLREFATGSDEVAGVVAEIRRLLASGVRPGDIALCYRVNRQSAPFEEAFAEAGIPYVVRGEGGFFDQPEVRQALRLLAQAARAEPTRAGPPPVGGSLPAAPPRADREVERVLREGLSFHAKREPAGQAAKERWANLAALLDLARARVQADPALTLADLVVDFTARAAAGHDTPDDQGAVTLVTLHRAKGLEYEAVLIVGVEEGLLPIGHAKDDTSVAEERRLLYVGATRARTHLWISWARSRTGLGGGQSRRRPSRFLHALRRPA